MARLGTKSLLHSSGLSPRSPTLLPGSIGGLRRMASTNAGEAPGVSANGSAGGSPSHPNALAQFGKKHVAGGIGRMTEMVMKSAQGCRMVMDGGRTFLDFTCGIGVTNLGHCHPIISKAAAEQCMSLVHGQVNIAYNEPSLKLIKALKPLMPDPSLDTFFFWNSGSEAVEASVKLARHATKRQNIIVMQGSYHGRTFGAMSLTKSKTIYAAGFGPTMPGVFVTPFPYATQMGLPLSTPTSELVESALFQLDCVLAQQTAPSDTAAILLEPVIGEGGYVAAPKEFLEGLRRVCDKHGMLLIIDEVQSGFGRTGTMFNIEQSGVRPDVMVMAKGIANGFPLSAIVSRKELMDRQPGGSMGGTYGSNAVACAAGVAVAQVLKEEKVLENVAARSAQMFSFLRRLQQDPKVGHLLYDVRGAGLMVGVEFPTPAFPVTLSGAARGREVPEKLASKVTKACVERGMLLLSTSMFEVARFIPPLNISEADLQEGLDIFKEALESCA